MAGNITPTNQFAAQAGPIPLSQLDANFNQSATQLNSLTTFSNPYLDTGTTNAWVITISAPQIVSYTFGLNLQVKVANQISGAVTLNVNGLGAKAVVNPDGTAMVSGNIVAGAIVDLFYDGTNFQCNGGTQGATGTVPSSRQILTTAPLTGGGDLTANRTLAVNTFGAAQAGVVPSSGGGTANYLRADGTWAAPAGATNGTVTSITFNAPLTGGTVTTTGSVGVSTFGAGTAGVVPASGGGTSNFMRADGNWAAPASQITYKSKAGNTGRSTVTPSFDPDLVYTIPGAGTFTFYLWARYGGDATSTSHSLANGINFTGSYTASLSYYFTVANQGGGGLIQIGSAGNQSQAAASLSGPSNTAGLDLAIFQGTLVATGTGTLGFSWAQGNTGTGVLTFYQPSWLSIIQIA